jgi:guanine deaminase
VTRILRGRLLRWADAPFEEPAALLWDEDGAVAFADGRILAAGPAGAVLAAHPGAAVERHADRIIAPAFVDCHVHYPQTGVIASWGAQLIDWLNGYTFPEESRFGDPGAAEATARTFFDLQLANGYATCCSFCTIHPASVDAFMAEAERRGLRAIGGKVMMDRNAPAALRDTAQSGFDDSAALIGRWHGRGRLQVAVSPRFAPTSTPAQLEAAGALWALHPDCAMQTHLSENRAEIDWVAGLFPGARDYLDVYERFGLLGPGAVFGHGVHLTARERARLAESGAAVAHCPTSNLFLGSGACDVAGLAAQGVTVGLATDTGGGSSFSPFATMRAAYELAQSRGAALTPVQLWRLATEGAAAALRLAGVVGNLAPGFEADMALLDPAATPVLAQRAARARTPQELLFALAILGDDRAVAETWSGGLRVHARGAGGRDG